MKSNRKVWIVVVIILFIVLSQEYEEMAKQTSLKNALIGFVVLTALVLGIVYWIKKSKKTKG